MNLIEKLEQRLLKLQNSMRNAVDSEQYAHICSRESGFLTAFSIVKQHQGESDWVSVDERLPDESGEYLVYCIGDSGFAKDRKARSVMLFNVEKNIWASLSPIFKVTHWQALPNPPSEVQSE